MNSANMLLATPEYWVLTMACVILVVDLFLSKVTVLKISEVNQLERGCYTSSTGELT